ncbi:hypothetical protein DK926_18890 [Rhodococcus sp. Eu-32]|uniref:hypothetical protein n=1 Tax=Rhodococcus sp. Eu-32 TaxID=1017319 RepID=UPI000DF191BD|nr:hypothetical protein [Rhodococcus sp. Eu-32]RRQ26312.1 hypothetical protein DK926_18890 [Rhodococcus sp. Eu-32]
MPFNPRTWFGKPNTTTPIDATNLNRIEKGIKDAHDGLGNKANAQAVADALADKLSETEADTRYAPLWQPSTSYSAGAPVLLPNGKTATRTANGTSRAQFDATEEALWTPTGGGLAKTEADALYAPAWKANTAVTAGQVVIAPSGAAISRIANGTTRANYDATEAALWTLATTPWVTDPSNIPILRSPGDGRVARWEYIHNGDSGGYIWHLLAGAQSAGGWFIGAGLDNGNTGFAIVRNKAQAVGFKIEQAATITSATAYGMAVEQKSALAPAVFMEQKVVTGGAAPLLQLISYETDATKHFFQWQGANGKGGLVRSATGVLEIGADIETNAAAFRARSNNTVAAASRSHVTLDVVEGTGPALTFMNNTGSAGSWWPARLRGNGSNLLFETAGQSTALGTFGTATEIMRLRTGGQLSFFGATAVAKRTGWAVPTGTAKRTTFDTGTVTLADLAGVVMALIQDLNGTTGYGLLQA